MKSLFAICMMIIIALSISYSQSKFSGNSIIDKNPDQTFTKFKNDSPLPVKDQILLGKINEIKNNNDPSKTEELNQLVKNLF